MYLTDAFSTSSSRAAGKPKMFAHKNESNTSVTFDVLNPAERED
jgi:hypothetical protein